MTFSPGTALVAAASVMLGGVVKGALGMGFPIVATPLLTLVLGPETAVVGIVVPSLMMNVAQAWQGRRFLAAADPVVRLLVPTLVTIVLGTVVGAYLLVALPARAVAAVVGVSVMLYAIVSLRGAAVAVPSRHLRSIGILVGFASGVLGGATGFFGLPLIVLFSTPHSRQGEAAGPGVDRAPVRRRPADRELRRAGPPHRRAGGALDPGAGPAAAGFVLGTAFRRRMSQAAFGLAIRLTLLTVGAGLAGRAAFAWLTAAG